MGKNKGLSSETEHGMLDRPAGEQEAKGMPLPSDSIAQDTEMSEMKMKLVELERKYDALYNLMLRSYTLDVFAESLRKEQDYVAWFELLKYTARRYLVICTVKDTPGSNMPERIRQCILDAGFSKFRTDLWRTYVGVIHRGKVIAQHFNENEIGSEYTYETMDESFRIWATSQAYRQGNRGDIRINGRDYSVNLRGVNIVAYDIVQRKLVDSIGLDTQDEGTVKFVHQKGQAWE